MPHMLTGGDYRKSMSEIAWNLASARSIKQIASPARHRASSWPCTAHATGTTHRRS